MLLPHSENKTEEIDEKTDTLTDENNPHEPINVVSSSESPTSSSDAKGEAEEGRLSANQLNQIVLYDPKTNNAQDDLEPIQTPYPFRFPPPSKVLPSIGAFTVQCAKCFKWRLIPTKQKYEEIREHILENPFFCETAREWRPEITCDDQTDITQDGSRLWAIDRPSIAQPPPGWQRLLHIRGEGSTKFADVYYQAPSGKKLRSMVEIQKFLIDHPEYNREGVTPSRFSFQIPRPLQENYVRKRPRLMTSLDDARIPEPTDATPLSWIRPEEPLDLQLGMPGLTFPTAETAFNPLMKRSRQQPQTQTHTQILNHLIGDPGYGSLGFETDKPVESRTASYGGN